MSDPDRHTTQVERSARAVFDALNDGDPERVRELFSPEFTDHGAPPDNPGGRDGFITVLGWLHGELGIRYEVHDVFGADGKVCIRATANGVHTSDDTGVAATDLPYEMATLHVYRGDETGVLTDHWACRDELEVMYQIGALERPEPPKALPGAGANRQRANPA